MILVDGAGIFFSLRSMLHAVARWPQPKREKFPPKPFLYLAFSPIRLYSNLDLSKTVLRQDLWNTSLSVPYK